PHLGERLAQAARWQREAFECLEALAAQDLSLMTGPPDRLDLARLEQLPLARQRNALRHWLDQQGAAYPGEQSFARIFIELIPARPDASPEIRWPGWWL